MMMSKNGRTSLLFVVMVVLLALATAAASNASGSRSVCVVKFVCGESTDEQDGERAVEGSYRTSINIFNPSTSTTPVAYSKKLSYTTPCDPEDVEEFETPGEISSTVNRTIGAGLSFDVDCREVFEEFGACGDFAEGFLVLTSSSPLKVTAVYTAGGVEIDPELGPVTEVSSVDVNDVTCTGATSSGGDDDDDD